jgi:hypothetical protein
MECELRRRYRRNGADRRAVLAGIRLRGDVVAAGVAMTRLINLMVRCVMSCVMMMSIHRSDETRVIDMAKQASGSQRPANGQQESDQQQQEGTAFHRLNRLPHAPLADLRARVAPCVVLPQCADGVMLAAASRHAASHWRQASAQTRQCSCMEACR